MQRVGILDYGTGNIGSIQNMIKRLGGDSYLVSNSETLLAADRLILPGVGHFDHGMKMLMEKELVEALKFFALNLKRPLLGICLGAQLMTNYSEEGELRGLGFFDAEVLHFSKLPNETTIRIPHMGWNFIDIKQGNKLLNELPLNPKFYFVHSYYMSTKDPEEILCTAKYKTDFAAGLHKENIWAVQFHPEKSHKFGMQLIRNFLSL